jgi:hypothetical protein
MLHPRWTEIMQNIDRLYHANTTSEGRIACITDYIIREISPLELQTTPAPCESADVQRGYFVVPKAEE